jgi:hypothetical protein
MSLKASQFVAARPEKANITSERIETIVWYVHECFEILLKDNPKYSRKYVLDHTSFHLEDYLKVEFVDSYLIANKHLITTRLSALEEINFSYETEKRFIDIDGKQKKDKIDIYINKLGLKEEWKTADEHIYFVLECKRISSLPGVSSYIGDIEKFCQRSYLQLRLPFEGMIGFIETKPLSPATISDEINTQLVAHTTIKTITPLAAVSFNKTVNDTYISEHKKSYSPFSVFKIYHLFLDYTDQIIP